MILRSKLFIVILVLLIRKLHAQNPAITCPNVFQYSRADDKNIGLITINKVNYGETVVEIELSQPGSIDSDYVGSLSLNFDKDRIFDYIKSGSAVTYKVDFALQNVIPQVSAIRLNGLQICFGPKVAAPSVTVTLKHTITAPGSSNTNAPQQSSLPHWMHKPSYQNLPWTTTTSSPTKPRTDFGYPNFLSATYNRQKDTISKDTSNPFFNGNNEFHYIFTIPSTTTTTTPRTIYDPRNPPGFLNVIRPPITTSSTTSTTTSTTTTTTPRPRPRPALRFMPSESRPPQSGLSSHFMPKSAEWTGIDSVCGQENFNFIPKKLAVKGEKIPRARFPWIVALFKKNVGTLSFQCGGSLITTRTVISAAHCFYTGYDRIRDEDILVSMGRHNLTDWSDTYIAHRDVERIIQHPDYKPELDKVDADIAIMQLKTSVTFSLVIRPVCLWRGRLDVNDIAGITGIVVGWGRDEENDVTTSPKLITANVASEIACIQSNEELFYLTSNRTLCAGNRDGSGPCTGDSGSGLMIQKNNKWMLRGTVSAALSSESNKCNLDEYVVYTDVAQFLGWIYANSVF